MDPTPVYGARAEKPPQNADFAMKQTNICRLSGDITTEVLDPPVVRGGGKTSTLYNMLRLSHSNIHVVTDKLSRLVVSFVVFITIMIDNASCIM